MIRIGIIGLGANTRLRHVPGLLACRDVQIVAVCNRSRESTERAAREFSIPQTYTRWQDLVADDAIDAVVIGTWPYLHAPITLAALEAGKHVLTEARMAATLEEARRMLEASRRRPAQVAQIVPSPFGLRAGQVVRELVDGDYLGELREAVVIGVGDRFADPAAPRHWRQSAEYSGVNMLGLGILHETLIRWIPDPLRVIAQTQVFTSSRLDPESGEPRPVETPDSVRVLTELPGGARGLYHLSEALYHGPGVQLHLYGSRGTLRYLLAPEDRLLGGKARDRQLAEITIPPEKEGGWRVEADFVDSIREGRPVTLTDFATGVRYMAFTDAVARSAAQNRWVPLP